ncbi:hypothetical protein PHLCEN_2v2624 [Hermanssonia centrifuga]|uniref:Aconitase A/isopropylmalate dehydratase small subunit swivel domain-containing protein n=1 Tax=Hermanssonia centrifuga TaxID=98765 RepID=A0A2R6RIP4_9APHY|nr:hypothetical protein PHLCEN_2v2624 [Hermanssonia centrifuga]
MDFGIMCVITPSFGDIFRSNMMQNGMLPIQLSSAECVALAEDAQNALELEVDLVAQEIRRCKDAPPVKFSIDPFRRYCLMEGLDDIALTLQKGRIIAEFEAKRRILWPWLDGFGYDGTKLHVDSNLNAMEW